MIQRFHQIADKHLRHPQDKTKHIIGFYVSSCSKNIMLIEIIRATFYDCFTILISEYSSIDPLSSRALQIFQPRETVPD